MTTVPSRIARCAECLRAMDPLAQAIRFYPASWTKTLSGCEYLRPVLGACATPGVITRADLAAISRGVSESQRPAEHLFLATMIWGFGTRGYGPYRTEKMLKDLKGRTRLTKTIEHLKQGEIIKAYDGFHVTVCGPAFFTKFFYAVGLGAALDPMPLVLDSVVMASLQDLEQDGELDAAQLVRGHSTVHRFSEGYARYVELLNGWARIIAAAPMRLRCCSSNGLKRFSHPWRCKALRLRFDRMESAMSSPKNVQQRKPFPAEDAVEDTVRAWLSAKGCTFKRRDYVDVVAREPDGGLLWVVEAKGETSDPGLDFRTCLGQILTAMRDDGATYAVAVPATKSYRRLCAGISEYVRRAIGLNWLLVSSSGGVWLVAPDAALPDAPFAEEHA